VNEAPEVKISSQKAIKKKDDEIARLRTELAHTKQQRADLQERINAAAEPEN
jgi:predicted RNase H-like nuclease (RuvC/YqgF family)